ncbi:Collagenase-like protease, PrtC family [Lachnospiraceae bacterium XBB2008]|nr:Collagenase-like protease, PrtC family [Lachnospiraceae bacterium XBB2008]
MDLNCTTKKEIGKKILAPISSINELDSLAKAGASEFYCGYVPEYWNEAFNGIEIISDYRYQIGLNRKDSPKANVRSLAELEKIYVASKQRGIDLFLTLNALSYPNQAYKYLRMILDEISDIGVRNVIVSDVGLMYFISNNYPSINLTVSCLAQVTNSLAAQFYKSFNLKRIVFPRHINAKEMIEIVKCNPDIEFEFFILGGKCIYDDGYCRCNHDFGPFCLDTFNDEFFSRNHSMINHNDMRTTEKDFYRWSVNYPINIPIEDIYRNIGCSICLLSRIIELNNLCSVKIAGRGKSLAVKQSLVKIASEALELASSGADFLRLQSFVKQTFEFNSDICDTDRYCFTRGDVSV